MNTPPPPAETAAAQGLRNTYVKFQQDGKITYANTKYALIDTGVGMAIGCFTCEKMSFNINDVLMKYCGNCHVYHETG